MQVPQGATSAHRQPLELAGTADGSGRAAVTAQQVPAGYRWLLDYVIVSTSGGPCACRIYDSTETYSKLLDGTDQLGNGAVANYTPPRPLGSSSQLLIVWTGCTPGDQVAARIEYRQEPEG